MVKQTHTFAKFYDHEYINDTSIQWYIFICHTLYDIYIYIYIYNIYIYIYINK